MKVEAQVVVLRFRGCFSHDDLFKVAGKPFQKAAVVFVLGLIFFNSLSDWATSGNAS